MVRTDLIVITPEVLSLIAEIDEFKGTWRALGTLAPERLQQLRKVATIESVGSSTRIEGARLTDSQVEALLSRVGAQSFTSRDEQEVAGYALVMETVFSSHAFIPISENHIRQLHALLLRYSAKDERHRGNYKTHPNRIEAFDESGKSVGVIFETTSPFDTPREMEELIAWYREASETKSLHPLIIAAVFVVVFLAIHPFSDGNGRLSRALTTLILLKAGYAYVPYSSLESIIEQNKEGYYLALRRTQAMLRSDSPDLGPWVEFFLRALAGQKRRLEAKVEREQLMRATMPELAVRILELAAEHGSVTVGQVIAVTGAPRGTVKKRLGELAAAGHLKLVGKGRGARYVLG
ncbi:MAG: Fic family protein [Phycisphaeraceae bacterium]|nr:Fic family protein [Phycisphaeraceae bacterium]MBX3405610.1 Fic family protein [Phycisphaeraceae bacterium]